MLRRQRTILNLLSIAGGSLSSTQVQKCLFLLRHETFLKEDSAFYEFLPYKFGPYSFAANREIESLKSYGYVNESVSGSATSLGITNLGILEANGVDSDTSRAVRVIATKYTKLPLKAMVRDVYARYPWYSCNSEAKELRSEKAPRRPEAPLAIYTMGYEDRSVDGFFDRLLRKGIRRIVDVRSNPVSRKYGFAKSSMSSIASKLGMGYIHIPELGITSDKRKGVKTSADFQRLFGYYERQVLPANCNEIDAVARLVNNAPSVLICMEKEAVDCHRSRLATRVAAITELNIVHL